MCLLVAFYRVVQDAPLIVGANREEAYARIGEPPQILDGGIRAAGGRDPVAGGTWLGVNERGVLVAATNRPRTEPPAAPRSRGLLVRDLLQCGSAGTAMDLAARELGGGKYAGCNVVCADAAGLYVVHAGDWLRIRPLPPGVHVLTTHDVDDTSDRRLGHALWWLTQRTYDRAADCVAALQQLCAQTGNGDPAICVRGAQAGTISSSIVVLTQPLARGQYLHAQGPPDVTPYADFSHLLTELSPMNGQR